MSCSCLQGMKSFFIQSFDALLSSPLSLSRPPDAIHVLASLDIIGTGSLWLLEDAKKLDSNSIVLQGSLRRAMTLFAALSPEATRALQIRVAPRLSIPAKHKRTVTFVFRRE